MDSTEVFVRQWRTFTGDDPRRVELLRRVARIHECMSLVLDDPKARPGERVRAAEAALKSCETFARATKLNLKDSAGVSELDSWDALLAFVRNFHATYGAAENTLRHADENGFRAFRDKYDAFLAEQGIGATADKP